MKETDIVKAELIREEVRRVINKMIDEEYDSLINEMIEAGASFTNSNIDKFIPPGNKKINSEKQDK